MKESHISRAALQGSIPDIAVIKLKPRRGNTESLGLRRTIMTAFKPDEMGKINLETSSSKQNVLKLKIKTSLSEMSEDSFVSSNRRMQYSKMSLN